jgi:polar amino acid transport system substrate-binding protein
MFRGVSDKCVAAGKSAVELVTYADQPSGIRMIQNDRADLLMGDSGRLDYAIAQMPNELERGYMILTDYKVGPGITKSMPELRQAVFDSLNIIQAEGTMKQLMVKYNVNPDLQRPVEMWTK